MSDLTVVTPSTPAYRAPALIALDEDAPRTGSCSRSWRTRSCASDPAHARRGRTGTAKGEELSTIELVLAHPGRARRRAAAPTR
ncbi:MAG: hypothetical protein U0869_04050 [Chloroflexota bacterium]